MFQQRTTKALIGAGAVAVCSACGEGNNRTPAIQELVGQVMDQETSASVPMPPPAAALVDGVPASSAGSASPVTSVPEGMPPSPVPADSSMDGPASIVDELGASMSSAQPVASMATPVASMANPEKTPEPAAPESPVPPMPSPVEPTAGPMDPTQPSTLPGLEGSMDGTGAFLPNANGDFVIEVEAIAANGWQVASELDGFTGDSYFVAANGGDSCEGNLLSYPIKIVESGEYQLHIYARQPPGVTWHEENDMWLRIPTADHVDGFWHPDACEKFYIGSEVDHTTGADRDLRERLRAPLVEQWRWWMFTEEPRQPARFSAGPGEHRVELAPRSRGFVIDRLMVHKVRDAEFRQPDAALSALWLTLAPSLREP